MAEMREGSRMAEKNTGEKNIAVNRRARHDYFLEETFETGIELTGTEIKSVRAGHGCRYKNKV